MGTVIENLRISPSDVRVAAPPWKVLVVDDEPEVHEVTRLVLGGFRFAERSLEFLSAFSAAQAREMLARHADVAVVLLDVVMESEQAGLGLVRSIREELRNPFVRIVLRTGQAGQAPEHEVIAAYDINDYKEKTELTASRLATTMYSALRAYRDMRAIEAHRVGLEHVIDGSARVFAQRSVREFADTVLERIGQFSNIEHGALYCAIDDAQAKASAPLRITATSGAFRGLVDSDARRSLPQPIAASLERALRERTHCFEQDHFVLHFSNSARSETLLFASQAPPMSALDLKLLEMFASNLAIAYENLHLNDVLLSSQLEMVILLAGAAETRSQETAQHVRRVGLLTELLGRHMGLPAATCELLLHAAPLHDIGKIGIPDTILNKPGLHTIEEIAIMRTHAQIGARMLSGSNRPLLRLAAEIAATHHENWDGSGYPHGLGGADIPISGRLTMVADVFDALGSRRCYKQPWPEAQIRAHMLEQSGRKFDPAIVDALLENWDAALALRRELPD
ncbi:DUF3369 domain-containing protein [Dokdonella sp.]|uniref:DUF3369 domain-containing protein n=1 Tax=Dokdonella sp. TaxID=2291710 RepID=UPI0025C61E7F|nr:DUF3369 domain-containing protein [Dokdonella sp.]MBX3689628.1 DUF3369 domain-containing protein [Dokdonella sp.]